VFVQLFSKSHCRRWVKEVARLVLSGDTFGAKMVGSVVVVLLNALSFASLACAANRKGQHTMAALLPSGAWLFGATGVLIWVWR
jgi:hypothetical protein